ncbi:MAG: ribonuclease III [Cyanobacteria bacterium J06598_1]
MTDFSLPTFNNKLLWQQAMTHSSFANEQTEIVEHNERLEFLGDAILTFLSGDYLYARYPDKPEGELTPMRAALVDQPQLCKFAQSLALGQLLRMGKGAEKEGGRRSSRLLCSAFEALVGAYFLDTGRDMGAVRKYIIPFFDAVVASMVQQGAKDDKTRLQEWAHQQGATPEYVELDSYGPDHAREFVVEVRVAGTTYGQGQGKSKQKAQKAAAKSALSKLMR